MLARFGPSYRRRFGARMPWAHQRAMDAIGACRTAALGGHVVACRRCGVVEYVYHSCRHRACPKCGRTRTSNWLEARRRELLPVPYFHVVFTLPAELRRVVRRHQRELYGALMRSAAESLMELAADARYVGGRIGVLAVLHTWARTLAYHPHVHCLVPAGGLVRDGTWRSVDRGWLVPSKAVARRFRGRFAALARRAAPGLALPGRIFRKPWVVHLDPARHGTETVLKYLARYVHRVALTNARLIAVRGEQVVFRYRERGSRKSRTMRLHGHEFLRRFLQHVVPSGLHKVRYYGLWSPTHKKTLLALRQRLESSQSMAAVSSPAAPQELEVGGEDAACAPASGWLRCRTCGGDLDVVAVLFRGPRRVRGPP